MKVRLVKPWQFRAVGSVLEIPDGAANLIITRGFAVVYRDGEDVLRTPETFAKPQPRVIRSRQRTTA